MMIHAYAAGLFDGEGHIAIAYRKGSGVGKGKYPRYFLYVSMSQNDKGAIDFLSDNYGGSARFVIGKRSYDKGIYRRYNWVLSCKAAAIFLRHIQPYSIVKADEIKVALSFQDSMSANRGRSKVSDAEIAFRKNCYLKIRAIRKLRVMDDSLEVVGFA